MISWEDSRMKNSFKSKITALVMAVLLVVGMSPAAYARASTASARIKIERASVKLAVGQSMTLAVDYTEVEELNDDRADVSRAHVYVDNYKIADIKFGSEDSNLEEIEITGLADGQTTVGVQVGRYTGQVVVIVGRGEKSAAQIKKEEAAKKAEEAILKNDKSELGAAMAEAIKKATQKEVIITTNTAKDPAIPVSTLKAIAARANQAKKNGLVRIDSPGADGKVQARLFVIPDGLTTLKSDFKTAVTIDASRRGSLGSDYIASVKCAHTGSFGMSAEIAVKVSAPKNAAQVAVYNVDSNGKLKRIQEPSCSIDKDGFLHFFTKQGGEIVLMKTNEKAAEE